MKTVKNILNAVIMNIGIKSCNNTVSKITKIIKSASKSVINISENHPSYSAVNRILYNLNPDEYERHRIPTTNKEIYTLNENIMYFIKLEPLNYLQVETTINDKHTYGQEIKLHLQFYGEKRYKYRDMFLEQAMQSSNDNKHIRIRYMNKYGLQAEIQTHSFDHIMLPDDVKSRIIGGLKNWQADKEWYEENEMVHKIGVLLHGKPGTGKSSVVKAISNMFGNAPILTLDPDNIMEGISRIAKARRRYNGVVVVLIEDFDMYLPSRDRDDILSNNANYTCQHAVFQLLDGIYSMDDTIYVATTNHLNRLDTALVRHGRFDIQEELPYFDEQTAQKYVSSFGYGEEILQNVKFPVQPARLQAKIMEYRAKIRQI